MKLADIKTGDIVQADDGFTCLEAGPHVVKLHNDELYIDCNDGKHFLCGQEDEPGSDLVGLS